jgi:hypothetical protein
MSDDQILELEIDEAGSENLVGNAELIILMIVTGFIGNLFVPVIYVFRMKHSNHRTFILCLGGLDRCI